MPTLKEAIEAKQRLCNDICTLIRGFEYAYDVGVTNIGLIRSGTLRDPVERTCAVEVQVEL